MRVSRTRAFGLLLNDAKRNAAACERGDAGVQGRIRRLAPGSLAARPAASVARRPARCAQACRPPAGARRCWLRRPDTPRSTVSALRAPTRRLKQSPALRTLCAYKRRAARAVRQRPQVRVGRRKRQEHAGRLHSRRAATRSSGRSIGAPARAVGRGASEWAYRENRWPIPCLTVKNQTPKIAPVDQRSGSGRNGAVTCLPS